MAEVKTISSNVSRLAIRRDAATDWLVVKPVSFADFGVEIEKEDNLVIEPGRNREKQIAVGVSAPGGMKLNFTPESFGQFADGIFLVNAKRTPERGGRFGTGAVTVVGTGFDIGADAATEGFLVNQLIYAEFFGTNANNGLHVVTGTTGNVVEVAGLTIEGSPPSDAKIKVVGYEFPTADADIAVTGGQFPQLTSTGNLANNLGLTPGEWAFIGGAAGVAANRFVAEHNNGLARVLISSAGALTFDLMSGGTDGATAPVTETGTGLDIRVFYGDFFRNVSAITTDFNPQLWELERTLGIPNPIANPGITQAEYLLEALINSVTIAAPAKKKLEFDLAFTGRDGDTRTGLGGSLLRTDGATLLDALKADAFNTSSNKLRNVLYLAEDPSSGNAVPTPLFRFLTEQTLTLSNNAVVEDAHGEFGALEIVPGDFSAGVEMTAHFAEVAAQQAVRNNLDVGYQLAYANTLRSRRAAVLFDIPAGSVGGGRNTVDRNASIKTPITLAGQRSDTFGYTASYTEFPFLP